MTPQEIRQRYSLRSPLTVNLIQFFAYSDLHPVLRNMAKLYLKLASVLVDLHADGPELTVCLRSLLDSREAYVRHYLATHDFKFPDALPRLTVVPSTDHSLQRAFDHLDSDDRD